MIVIHPYGFDIPALSLLYYLKNRKQRVQIDRTFSSREKTLLGIPQGLLLKSLLFNIFM